MSRRIKSQWDFGELPLEPERRVLSVTEITAALRKEVEQKWARIWVRGELTNLRLQSSGHAYFSLKDSATQIQCVLFRGEAPGWDRSLLVEGQTVIVAGGLTVYEARGQYQLRVTQVELAGVGALQAAFERLKRKLHLEGLFAVERKRPLPRYPRSIGLVTSPTGAAIRDVLHVLGRRFPALELILAPCRVQGSGAAEEMAAAIAGLNTLSPRLELILLTRGGGSLEDLWAFNEEVLARAIFASETPVVSAVGHEIDFTIADFVADFRAATPSAAAEIITEHLFAARAFLAEVHLTFSLAVRARFEMEFERAAVLCRRLGRLHPQTRIEDQAQRLDDALASLVRIARSSLKMREIAWRTAGARLLQSRPGQRLPRWRKEVGRESLRLTELCKAQVKQAQARVSALEARLQLLSPTNVLRRGYSITLDAASGAIIRSASEVRPGQKLETQVKSGRIKSVAE